MGKEERIRALTKIYYSNPKVAQALLDFAKNREVVPRYYEGFGKRPDTLQYPSDVQGLVKKGATSFHASEEIWEDPLKIDSDMTPKELSELRTGWDLLIDIDSKYLDFSKIAAKLLIQKLEFYEIKNYGIKFSGSKGFHLIIPGGAFPKKFKEVETKEMFPEWPRAICQFLMNQIKPEYNKIVSQEEIDFESLQHRTNLKKEDLSEVLCPECSRPAKEVSIIDFTCPICKDSSRRIDIKLTKRKLKCLRDDCPGILEISKEEKAYKCEYCGITSFDKLGSDSKGKLVLTKEARKNNFSDDFKEGLSGDALADLDLVLVAPRHLFRMPYSLHEKTGLASIVLKKEELEGFTPKDADPFKIEIRSFVKACETEEGRQLLASALDWYGAKIGQEERVQKKDYKNYEEIKIGEVTEDMFPKPIKKLLKGMQDGKKRGLFILITFLRSLNFPADYINQRIREWNEKNETPLREGYVKSQIDWHLKQRKKILPPNYDNEAFYKDLGLLDETPKVKNPLVEVMRKARRREDR